MSRSRVRTRPTAGRRRRVATGAGAVVVVLLTGWLAWGYAVIATPRVDAAAPVDAVLVLGGLPTAQRTERALAMADAGQTRTLVISVPGNHPDRVTRSTCADPPAGLTVVCFDPDPSTTQGEAQEIGRLAAEHGWTRIAVVTSTYHVSRSRLIVGRCFGGTILMVTSTEAITWWQWAYQYVYQTGAYVKAELLRSC